MVSPFFQRPVVKLQYSTVAVLLSGPTRRKQYLVPFPSILDTDDISEKRRVWKSAELEINIIEERTISVTDVLEDDCVVAAIRIPPTAFAIEQMDWDAGESFDHVHCGSSKSADAF